MFDIRLEGYSMDLKPGTQIVLEKYNPILDFETVQGSRVNSFTLPDTPANRRILGYFYDPAEGVRNRRFKCEKYVDSQVIESGYVKIQKGGSGETTLYFTQNLGEIFGDRQTISLAEMDFASLALPSNPGAGANHLVDPYCMPSIENPGFYGNQGFGGVVNKWNGSYFNSDARIPHFFLKWILEQFGQLTGWRFQGAFLSDPDFLRLCLANLYSLDGGGAVIQPKNHLPDLTIGRSLIELRKLFNLYLDFDIRRKVCDIGFVDDVLKAACLLDWTQKANPVHTKTPDLQNRLDMGYELDGNDASLKPIPILMDRYITPETTLNEGGSALSFRSKFSTYQTNPVSGLAMCSQAGISPNNRDSTSKGSPKLLFWNGLIDGQPRATARSGSRSLYWHGPNNLAETHYSRFERFKADTFQLQKLISLTPADLATFSFRHKIHIKGVNYLVGSMKAVFQKDQKIIPGDCTLYKI